MGCKWENRSSDLLDLTFVSRSPIIFSMEKARENGILVIAASIIAVIRLRGEPIERSLKVVATISDSAQLTRMVLTNHLHSISEYL